MGSFIARWKLCKMEKLGIGNIFAFCENYLNFGDFYFKTKFYILTMPMIMAMV